MRSTEKLSASKRFKSGPVPPVLSREWAKIPDGKLRWPYQILKKSMNTLDFDDDDKKNTKFCLYSDISQIKK